MYAQDSIAPLQRNGILNTYVNSPENAFDQSKKHRKHGEPHTQYLPFFDDFSKYGLYPNDTMWLDRDVYISNHFGINPPSTGVVVFDGLDARGRAYNSGDQSTGVATTDTLTSTYIDISSFTAADSIYLSFYYQPSGFGDAQISDDSLILQFHPDSAMVNGKYDDSAWITVWAIPGRALHDFRQVMIPVVNKAGVNYFHKKFQFRLYAYGHRSGNLDQWHVDYFYMNRGRSRRQNGQNQFDPNVQDVAVYKPSGSILNKYYSMPVKQFLAAGSGAIASDIRIFARNNSNITKNVTYGYTITNAETGALVTSFTNTTGNNVNAFSHDSFPLINKLTTANVSGDRTTLLVNTIVENIPDNFRMNDTATHKQVFDKYLAYDDGTAEGGYGLVGTNIGKVAVRYTLYAPDTLYGIMMHFNQANKFVGGRSVNIGIWNDLTPAGSPEKDEFDARITFVRPVYDGINNFAYFAFDQPIPVNNEFYIGWIQNQEFYLNIGFDKNYENLPGVKSDNLYISTTGKWQASKQNGIPMIRPYFGNTPPVGMEETARNRQETISVNIYPNPNNGNFTVSLADRGYYEINIFDIAGKAVQPTIFTQESTTVNLLAVQRGMYLVKITDTKTGSSVVKKISVLR